MKKIWKRVNFVNCLIIPTFFLFGSTTQAAWEPENCLEDIDYSSLDNFDFKNLKITVVSYLQNSWCSSEKANLLMELTMLTRPEVCVEIGAFTGSSVLPVAATLKYLNHGKIYAIDAWSNAEVIRHLDSDDPNRPWWESVNMKDVFNAFQDMATKWDLSNFCIPVKTSSEDAAPLIGDIDFLHLDGDYSEYGSVRDVNLYVPKVKSGGYILLSNLFTMVKGKQPKLKAFCALFDSCEMVCEIENDNAILFRKR